MLRSFTLLGSQILAAKLSKFAAAAATATGSSSLPTSLALATRRRSGLTGGWLTTMVVTKSMMSLSRCQHDRHPALRIRLHHTAQWRSSTRSDRADAGKNGKRGTALTSIRDRCHTAADLPFADRVGISNHSKEGCRQWRQHDK